MLNEATLTLFYPLRIFWAAFASYVLDLLKSARGDDTKVRWRYRNSIKVPRIAAESFHPCMNIFVFNYVLVFNDRL